jgi:hypothetical protein
MPVHHYTRSSGQRLVYTISYDPGTYFIKRGDELKKSIPDAIIAGIVAGEAKASLMLRMAIADIEGLAGMNE